MRNGASLELPEQPAGLWTFLGWVLGANVLLPHAAASCNCWCRHAYSNTSHGGRWTVWNCKLYGVRPPWGTSPSGILAWLVSAVLPSPVADRHSLGGHNLLQQRHCSSEPWACDPQPATRSPQPSHQCGPHCTSRLSSSTCKGVSARLQGSPCQNPDGCEATLFRKIKLSDESEPCPARSRPRPHGAALLSALLCCTHSLVRFPQAAPRYLLLSLLGITPGMLCMHLLDKELYQVSLPPPGHHTWALARAKRERHRSPHSRAMGCTNTPHTYATPGSSESRYSDRG